MGSSAHNVSAPALSIRDPDCHGWLFKQGFHHKSWKRRYCVLKSGCLYYYLDMTDQTAKGVMHMAGYTLKRQSCVGKKHYFMAEPPRADMRPFYFYATSELEYRRLGPMESLGRDSLSFLLYLGGLGRWRSRFSRAERRERPFPAAAAVFQEILHHHHHHPVCDNVVEKVSYIFFKHLILLIRFYLITPLVPLSNEPYSGLPWSYYCKTKKVGSL